MRGIDGTVKMALSSAFVASALVAGALGTAWGTLLLVGLVASWVGDLALLGRSRTPFVAGLAAFTAAHISYAAAFIVRGVDSPMALGAAAAMAVIWAGILMWLRPHTGALLGAVAVYMTAVAVMVALAVGTHAHETAWLLVVGAIGFAASDIAVARERFVVSSKMNRRWGRPAYFAAQFLIAIASGR